MQKKNKAIVSMRPDGGEQSNAASSACCVGSGTKEGTEREIRKLVESGWAQTYVVKLLIRRSGSCSHKQIKGGIARMQKMKVSGDLPTHAIVHKGEVGQATSAMQGGETEGGRGGMGVPFMIA